MEAGRYAPRWFTEGGPSRAFCWFPRQRQRCVKRLRLSPVAYPASVAEPVAPKTWQGRCRRRLRGPPAVGTGMKKLALASCAFTMPGSRSEEHTSELQSPCNLVCRLLLEKKK